MTDHTIIREVAAAETHDLRRRILRDGAAAAIVEWQGDDESTTFHLGAAADGRIVAISTWLITADPLAPDLRAMQLRGMATDPVLAGKGFGRALIDAGVQRASDDGVARVWANARVTSLGFYEAAGWIVTGPVFETVSTGLAHRHVHTDLV